MTKKLGIVVDNAFYHDIRVQNQIKILQEQDLEIFVLCFDFNDGQEKKNLKNVHVDHIQIKRIKKNLMFLCMNTIPVYEKFWTKHIHNFINKYELDILHVHDLYLSKSAYKGIKKSNFQPLFILDLHENFPIAIQTYEWTKHPVKALFNQPKKWEQKEAEYLKYADRIITLSPEFKKVLVDRYSFLNKENVYPVPNFINIKNFESYEVKSIPNKLEGVVLFYFGAIAERRGIPEFLEVFEKGRELGLPISLRIIGPVDKSYQASFNAFVEKHKQSSYFEFIPWIHISELNNYMQISDIMVSPLLKNAQHESGIANKIYQYLYAAKPLLVSNCVPQQNLVEENECGLVYANKEECLDQIKQLVKQPELRTKMGENGRNALYEKYNTENYTSYFLKVYQDII